MTAKESTWVEEVCPYSGEPTGWIVGVVEYAGCGSHEAEWSSEENKRVALAAPDLLEALEALVDRDLTYDGPCIVIPAKNHSDAISIVRRARNSIARARGEQSQSEKEVGNG